MFNQNMGAFKGGMLAVDAMLHVQQRVFHDLVNEQMKSTPGLARHNHDGYLITVYRDADGMVDFSRYMREYYLTVGFIEFVRSWSEWGKTHRVERKEDGSLEVFSAEDLVKEEDAEAAAAAVAGPSEDEGEDITTVFGGDVGVTA